MQMIVFELSQGRQTRLRSQHSQMSAKQQPVGPVTESQLAQLHQQINQHTQLLMQVCWSVMTQMSSE